MATRVLKLLIDGDTKGFESASKRGQKALDGWRGSFAKWNQRAVTASLGVAGAAAGAARHLVGLASEAQQSLGAVDTVFSRNAAQVKQWAQGAAESVGLSAHAYRELAAVTGAQLKNMGVAQDEVAAKTNNLIGLGGDLAATFGGPTSDAVAAIGSLLRGERDPIERYGVSIKQADINARLAAQGLDHLEGAERREAETKATLAILTEQTAAAQGQFARETGSAAGQAQIAAAQWENLRTKLGMRLLPVFTAVMGFISGTVLPLLDQHQGKVALLAGVIVGLAGFVLAANAAWKVYTATVKAVRVATVAFTATQKVLNLVMRANPIGIVITLIAGLVAGFITAYKKSETFRRIVDGAMAGARRAIGWVVDRGRDLIGFFTGLPGKIRSGISSVADAIKSPFISAFRAIKNWWNSTVAGFGFTVPGWVPFAGGKSFRIPRMHSGGLFQPADGRSEGLALLRRGERVRTPGQQGRDEQVTVTVNLSRRLIEGIAEVVVSRGNRELKRAVLAGEGSV